MPASLPLRNDQWRSRWLVLPSWNVLHRVAEIAWEGCYDEDTDPAKCDYESCRVRKICQEMIRGDGLTVCGRRGHLHMPGIFSRMGLPRCAHCCRILCVPCGDGAPFNSKDVPWKDA